MKKIITVKGTHCMSCKMLIEDVAKDVEGVLSCNVDFKTGKTVIEYDDYFSWEKLKKEIDSLADYSIKA